MVDIVDIALWICNYYCIIFKRGIPEEVLTDQGTQFMSECMQEVSRLLSIKSLTSTPYHTICNGLVERWNGTLKSMLKRLCQEKQKQWHRLIKLYLAGRRFMLQGPVSLRLLLKIFVR